jgi:peptidoglycan/xylan/chitin deacetylase (PgdA/CDA1 family)
MTTRAGIAFVLLTLACARTAPPPTASPPPLRIAVTIDDLPFVGQAPSGSSRLEVTHRLLATLTAREIPAVGFVVCAGIDPAEPILAAWRAAGMELANHSHSHWDLNQRDPAEWLADVRRCHDTLATSFGPAAVRYFRFPFLHVGATPAHRAEAKAALTRLGTTIAPVTIDNADYLAAAAYGHAVRRGDEAARAHIARIYVEHMLAAITAFERLGQKVVGRPIPHILLLHANLLAADHFATVLDALAARGARFIPLGEALADPIYAAPHEAINPTGSWLYHLRPGLYDAHAPEEKAREAELVRALQRARQP